MVDGGLTLEAWPQQLLPLLFAFQAPMGPPSALSKPGQSFSYGQAARTAFAIARAVAKIHPAVRALSYALDLAELYVAHKGSAGYRLVYSVGCCVQGSLKWCANECVSTSQSGNIPCIASGACTPPVYTGPNPTRVCGFKERIDIPGSNNYRSVWMYERDTRLVPQGGITAFDPQPVSPTPNVRTPGIRPPYDPATLPDPARPPTQPKPTPVPDPVTEPRPWPFPSVEPDFQPFPQPQPLPDPSPVPPPWIEPDIDWRTPPDWYPDVPRPQRWPVVDPDPNPLVRPGAPGYWPVPWPMHPLVPLPVVRPRPLRPRVSPDVSPGTGGPAPQPVAPRPAAVSPQLWDFGDPTKYRPSPPGRRTRERKVVRSSRLGPLEKPFSNVTEALDFINCLHDALPKRLKAKPRLYKAENQGPVKRGQVPIDSTRAPGWRIGQVSFKRKMEAVYKAIGQDPTSKELQEFVAKGLACHAQNQAQDEIIARLSKGAAKSFGRATGRSVGVGVGPAL